MDKEILKGQLKVWVQNEILVMIKEVVANQDATKQKELADLFLDKIVNKIAEGK